MILIVVMIIAIRKIVIKNYMPKRKKEREFPIPIDKREKRKTADKNLIKKPVKKRR